ncbi:MAG: hypothetical protein H0T48_11700 [Gemmatimonadaceae bacterium]|nr:hypothetical protein [Gemmatimonadaceae bacterium]
MFSFIEDPDNAIEAVTQFASLIHGGRVGTVSIDQHKCTQIDLCAEAVTSALAVEARERLKVRFRGILPADEQQRAIIIASGLPRHLGVNLPEQSDFLTFGLVHGRRRKESAYESSERELVSTSLTEYVNQCVGRYRRRLMPRAEEFIASIVGEVIGNAEDHSRQPNWWAAAYLHHQADSGFGDCHITLFNFGQTVFESLQYLPQKSLLRTQIESLVGTHQKRGLFHKDWTPENLWTLYALQEGVSRFNTGKAMLASDRGQGTADMIEFFQRLGQSEAAVAKPKMCFVSGKTHVVFDGNYTMERRETSSGTRRRILAFNKENDLGQKPDFRAVRPLNHYFPGTLISLRFYLDADHLKKIGDTTDDSFRS